MRSMATPSSLLGLPAEGSDGKPQTTSGHRLVSHPLKAHHCTCFSELFLTFIFTLAAVAVSGSITLHLPALGDPSKPVSPKPLC